MEAWVQFYGGDLLPFTLKAPEDFMFDGGELRGEII